jgi:oligoendopeptidase F
MKNTKNTLSTEWNLGVFYKDINDPQMKKDMELSKKAYIAFAKKYTKDKSFLKSDKALAEALIQYQKLYGAPMSKVSYYLAYRQVLDGENNDIRAKLNLIEAELRSISNEVVFFDVELSKIPVTLQKKFLVSKKLAPYHYFLERMFIKGKHVLSTPEEKIMSLKSQPSYSMWVDANEKLLQGLMVEYKGKQLPYAEAYQRVHDLPTQEERAELDKATYTAVQNISSMAEVEINAIVVNKKIDDTLRGYKNPYDATIESYENDPKTVLKLVEVVTTHFPLSARFYALKKNMLNLTKFMYSDRAAKVGEVHKKISFEESFAELQRVFGNTDSLFRDILDRLVYKGQVDVFPKKGKRGGAFCSHGINQPTMVMLNHTDNLESHSTFAHEMGHAIHSELSKKQNPLYEGYSTATAEVASTFFEMIVFYDAFEKMNDEEKIVALHDKISDDAQTIFRQIAFFNFEKELHATIREKGSLSKEEMAQLYSTHLSAYLGSDVIIPEHSGYQFASVPHFRNFFYVYSYAFGQLASKALYAKYKENPKFIEKIKEFLSAGGSMSPEDIFKSIGVNVTKPDFFEKGIKTIEDDINLLEKLVSEKKKK